MSAEKIESELDKKINKYNKYSDTHPMMGINYDKSNKNYKVRYETIKMNAKTIDVACEKIKECILSKYGEYDLIHQSMFKRKKFINDDKMIVGYIIFNEIFFDIQHVLIFLGFGESRAQQIYLSNKENITYRFLHANVYGGYIIRELICITSIKKILHDSNKRKSVTLSKLIGMEIINTKKPTKENSTIDSIITVFHKEEYMEQYSILGYYIDLYFHTHKIVHLLFSLLV